MGFAQGFAVGAGVKDRREAARVEKEIRDQELQRLGYEFDDNGNMTVRGNSAAEVEQLQAQEAAQLAKSLQGKLAAQATDQAFEDFAYTGDASYLQKALDSDPMLKQAWGERGVQMVGNIDFDNDRELLSRAGFGETFYDTDEKKSTIKKNAYKIYDGKEWSIGLANQAMAETGALRRMGKRRAEPLLNNYEEFVGMMKGPKVSPNTVEGHKYESLITAAAEKYDIPPNLIAAVMHQESAGKKDAVSHKGATGLMQLMPATAKELGVTDITDPAQNIDGGAKYLSQMLDRYDGDLSKALAAYNAGPGNVDKYGGIPPFGETQNYVQKIMGNINEGERFYGRDYDGIANTILEHRRAVANASQGTTNENVDEGVKQRSEELAIRREDNQIKILQNHTKIMTEGVTTKQKDLNAAAKTTTELLDQFGGEEEFYNTDFSDPQNYRDAYQAINKIERLEGTELSDADKKNITDIRALIALGDPAAKLTAGQTGLLDSNLKTVEKYLSDNVDGVAAKSAYAAFRNSVRNALFGSALTEHEIKAFNEAYGTLGQKLGPVLQTFETSLSQVQAKLDSTANLMNPLSAKVRLGADQTKIMAIRDALQARIDYIKGLQSGNIEPGQTPKSSKNRKSLDSIFKE